MAASTDSWEWVSTLKLLCGAGAGGGGVTWDESRNLKKKYKFLYY